MSLVGFHKVLIGAAILFCLLFGGWQILEFVRLGGWSRLALGGGFALAGGGLALYLGHLRRFLGETGG